MVGPTQAEINEAVMIAKNATYKLAYELSLEQKYGGVIDCCVTKLKLLWMHEQALSCQLATGTAVSTLEIRSMEIYDTINVKVAGVTISGVYTAKSASEGTVMSELTSIINGYQSRYVATYSASVGVSGRVTITSPVVTTEVVSAEVTSPTITLPVVTVTDLEVINNNCLTNEKAKKLIAKIKSMCNTN